MTGEIESISALNPREGDFFRLKLVLQATLKSAGKLAHGVRIKTNT